MARSIGCKFISRDAQKCDRADTEPSCLQGNAETNDSETCRDNGRCVACICESSDDGLTVSYCIVAAAALDNDSHFPKDR
jgi:hypothetical protein